MDKIKLRGWDIVSSLVFIVFALWSFVETFQMPMTETYGGVSNVWYVSPALFPLIVSSGLLVLGFVLLKLAIRDGGYAYLKESWAKARATKFTGICDRNQKFTAILIFLCGQIYVFMPTVDFYLSMVLFILVFVSAFYFEDMRLLRRMAFLYLGICAILLALVITDSLAGLDEIFAYSADLFVLVALLITTGVLVAYGKGDAERQVKSRRVIILAYLSPFLLIVLFKFLLLIPMPHEGAVIEVMSEVSYNLRSHDE